MIRVMTHGGVTADVRSEGRPHVVGVLDLQLQLSDADLHNTSSRSNLKLNERLVSDLELLDALLLRY